MRNKNHNQKDFIKWWLSFNLFTAKQGVYTIIISNITREKLYKFCIYILLKNGKIAPRIT